MLKVVDGIFDACWHYVNEVMGYSSAIDGIFADVLACSDVHATIDLPAVTADYFGVETGC